MPTSTCVTVEFHDDDGRPHGRVRRRGWEQPFVGWLELFVLLRSVHTRESDHERELQDRPHDPPVGHLADLHLEPDGARSRHTV